MTTFIRGQRSKLSALGVSDRLLIGVDVTAPGVTMDVSCFGLDADGRLSDDRYFIFFNQKVSPCGAVSMLDQSGPGRAAFSIDLSKLPAAIHKLAFTATVDGPGKMTQITSGYLLVHSEGGEAAVYEFTGADFGVEKAIIIAEVYLKDVWRFAAVGQGFSGDLATLVRHYGGEVAEETAPPPPAPRPAPQSPPTPRNESPPRNAPPPPPDDNRGVAPRPALFVSGGDLREVIANAPAGGTVELLRGEYQGPIVIEKPLTIRGNKSTLWCQRGPVVTVAHEGVSLSDVDIQVTLPDEDDHGGDGSLAIKLVETPDVALENVSVRGNILGLDGEGGEWRLPLILQLGGFPPRCDNSFVVSVTVPVACRLKTEIEGLSITPDSLDAGTHDICLTVGDVLPNTLILGRIHVSTRRVVRVIDVTGHTVEAGAPPRARARLET